MNKVQQYAFFLTFRNPTFIVADLVATAKVLDIYMELDQSLVMGESPPHHFAVLGFLSDEDASLFASKSIVTRFVTKLHHKCNTMQQMLDFCSTYDHNFNDFSFAIRIESSGKKIENETRLNIIKSLISSLRLTSKVDLENPELTLSLFLAINGDNQNEIEYTNVYFCTSFCDGWFHLPDSLNLKKVIFIKKTSMEASVAFHSAVQTLCCPVKIVYDQFVGSGSLIVSSSKDFPFDILDTH